MKTNFINNLLIVSLTVLISLHVNATIAFFSEGSTSNESNNKEIVTINTSNIKPPIAEFSFTEENYIDDIPFNTEYISAKSKYEEAMDVEFSFEEEEYIDDIKL